MFCADSVLPCNAERGLELCHVDGQLVELLELSYAQRRFRFDQLQSEPAGLQGVIMPFLSPAYSGREPVVAHFHEQGACELVTEGDVELYNFYSAVFA